eukprot:scaffold27160_cov24-Phaeocystis_antarctica.AAC.1
MRFQRARPRSSSCRALAAPSPPPGTPLSCRRFCCSSSLETSAYCSRETCARSWSSASRWLSMEPWLSRVICSRFWCVSSCERNFWM